MKAEITRNAINVFKNETLLKSIDKELSEIERLAESGCKWDMIQWAIDKKIEFVASCGTHDDFLHINDIDFKYLEQLYKERENL